MKAIRLLLILILNAGLVTAQQREPAAPPSDEVVRVNTDLILTDVAVIDTDGRFVEKLTSQDFEIRLNGKSREISSVDRVQVGSGDEERQITAARGRAESSPTGVSPSLDRGRTYLFYLDDYHLASGSMKKVKELLLNFVDRLLGQNDELAIVTASGQLGVLQQLTADKDVLHLAIERIALRHFDSSDPSRTPMRETDAMAIIRGDRRVMDYFVEQLLREMMMPRPRGPSINVAKTRSQAETTVRERAQAIVDQSNAITSASLKGLERLTRSLGAITWRKTLFFVSDGFFFDGQTNSSQDILRIADAAARSGTIIYSIEGRGLISGTAEASTKVAFDNTARLASNEIGAVDLSQQPLRDIAIDTGGRAFLNSNDANLGTASAIKETSDYYLVAWRPVIEDLRSNGFQLLEVSIRNRPSLNVRVRRGFFLQSEPVASAKDKNSRKATRETELGESLHSMIPRRSLPVSLSVGYLNPPGNLAAVTATIELDDPASIAINPSDTHPLEIQILGTVIDEHGKSVGAFQQNLHVSPAMLASGSRHRVTYNQALQFGAGVYQVRVAVQDQKTGAIGTAYQWINVVPLVAGELQLSSIFLGAMDDDARQTGKLPINANHRFRANERLGFFFNIINANHRSGSPDVAVQVQILRDDQPVVTRPLVKLDFGGLTELDRVPYGEDIPLSDLTPGRYVLRITAIDRIAKTSAVQSSRFTIY